MTTAKSPLHIEEIARPTHDELARQHFVSSLRKQVMIDMAGQLKNLYTRKIEPNLRIKLKRPILRSRDIRRAMLEEPFFKSWSALRYAAQEMTWWSVQPQVERNLPELILAAKRIARSKGPGSLRLNSKLPIPKDVTRMDIHLMPGCFHTEHEADDVAAGAVYWHGTSVFSAGLKLRHKNGGVARSIAEYLKIAHPDFKPQRMLDIGCSAGNQLHPYLDVFKKCEGYGVDVAAPLLRFAHARSRNMKYNIHYSQQNAEKLDYPDNHFDLVVSSFFLHEQSALTNRNILAEAHRLLRPGGVMVHMELPPSSECDPYYDFYLDWDAYYNNEPHYAGFRKLDFAKECYMAGFAKKEFFSRRIPNYGTVSNEEFSESARGERPAPQHGNWASWFIFGAFKT